MKLALTAVASLRAEVDAARSLASRRVEPPPYERWCSPPRRPGRMDRASLHALWAAHEALRAVSPPERASLALVLGTALGCAEVNELYHRGLVVDGADHASPALFAQTIPSGPLGEVSIATGARGPAMTVMAGRCSAAAALASARRTLLTGRADRVLVIASDAIGEDREPVRAARGEAPGAEATVAMLLERDGAFGRRVPLATLAHAVVTADEPAPAPEDVDWMGAAAVIELPEWLSGESSTLAVTVRDGRARADVRWAR